MSDKKVELANFEENLHKLEKLLVNLEDENLSLEKSLQVFEDGVTYYKNCQQILDIAQKKLDDLLAQIEKES